MNVRAATGGFAALALVLLAACSGGDPEPKPKVASDVPAGTIVFRRFLDAEQSQAALFTMSTDGKHERQITGLPRTPSTRSRTGRRTGSRSSSTASSPTSPTRCTS